MNVDTKNNDHWATDLNLTEEGANEYSKFVKDSISDAVFKSKKVNILSQNESYFLHNNESLLELNIPSFSKKYSIQTEKKYTSKTQKWIGHVVSIEDEKFTAILEDLNKPGTNEICDFDIYDISPDDRTLLKKGASFYWRIGYNNSYGQRRKESIIKFRRLGILTKNEIDKIEDRADRIYNSIKWD